MSEPRCLCGKPESDSVHHRPQASEEEHAYEPAPTEAEFYGTQPEDVAQQFHETYERLAPLFGYETRRESAVPWEDVPEQNRRLMVAVCGEVAAAVRMQALRDAAVAALGMHDPPAPDCVEWAAWLAARASRDALEPPR